MTILYLSGCSIAATSSGSGSSSSSGTSFTHTNRVAVIGDSISFGINPEAGTNGWVHILSNNSGSIWADTACVIGNFAISGDTAAGWNNTGKIQPVIDFHPDIVIVFIGANDLFGYLSDGVFDSSEKTALSNNYYGIINKVTNGASNAQLVIVNYYDLFDGQSSIITNNPMYSSYFYLSNFSAYTVEGNTMFGNFATNLGAKIVNNYTGFMNHCYGQAIGGSGHVSPDYVRMPIIYYDIHPITAGHQLIFSNVLNVLKGMTVSN